MTKYPLLNHCMAVRFDRSRDREDDGAIIAAWAAMQFQDHPQHFKDGVYHSRLCVEAWSDAINGGIVLC